METLKNAALALLLAAFAAALLLFPSEAAEAARQSVQLCLQTVLPALFPFFVLSSLLVACGGAQVFGRALEPFMRPLFHLSGAGAAALALGLVGGYPVGARTAAELYRGGCLPRKEAERLLAFCSNAGPGFILGICGGAVLQSARAGAYLYLVHVASALLTGVALRGKRMPDGGGTLRAGAPRQGLLRAFPAAVPGQRSSSASSASSRRPRRRSTRLPRLSSSRRMPSSRCPVPTKPWPSSPAACRAFSMASSLRRVNFSLLLMRAPPLMPLHYPAQPPPNGAKAPAVQKLSPLRASFNSLFEIAD